MAKGQTRGLLTGGGGMRASSSERWSGTNSSSTADVVAHPGRTSIHSKCARAPMEDDETCPGATAAGGRESHM